MFAISLADRLGYVHVDDMLHEMTPREFDERYAHEVIEPLGRRNAVIVQAEIMAAARLVGEILTASKSKKPDTTPDDLMPKFKSEAVKAKRKRQRVRAGLSQVKAMLGF